MDFMSARQAAEKWNISERRVRVLCGEGKVYGAFRVGRAWNIPSSTQKPADGRFKKENDILDRIAEKKARLDSMRPLTEGEAERIMQEFTIEFTYNSNAIEGNTLTLRETDMVLQGITIDTKPLKDHMEAIGHRDAFNYVLDLVKEKAQLTEPVIKQIHSIVLMDKPQDRGVYRKVPVRIMGALHIPPQPYKIAPQMEQLLYVYQSENSNIIEKTARFHIEFEGIHPFIDGNGRTGRLLANLELMKASYPPIDIKFQDRARYYKAFDEFYGNNDADAMIKLFAEYVEKKLDRYLELLIQ